MRFTGIISLILLAAFVVMAYYAGWWNVIETWDAQTKAVVAWVAAIVWSISNDFNSHGGGS